MFAKAWIFPFESRASNAFILPPLSPSCPCCPALGIEQMNDHRLLNDFRARSRRPCHPRPSSILMKGVNLWIEACRSVCARTRCGVDDGGSDDACMHACISRQIVPVSHRRISLSVTSISIRSRITCQDGWRRRFRERACTQRVS